MKKIIRLTEQDLHNIVRKSVNRILREGYEDEEEQEWVYYVYNEDSGYESEAEIIYGTKEEALDRVREDLISYSEDEEGLWSAALQYIPPGCDISEGEPVDEGDLYARNGKLGYSESRRRNNG